MINLYRLIGPQFNIGVKDVDALVGYGLLAREGKNELVSFSRGFTDFVRHAEAELEIWPLLRDTERTLQNKIESSLVRNFGVEWYEALKKVFPKLRKQIEDWQALMEEERARFGARKTRSLLAYSSPLEIFEILSADWHLLGEPLFGPDKHGWASRFAVLTRVRRPLSHNPDEVVSNGERQQAEAICKAFLDRSKGRNCMSGFRWSTHHPQVNSMNS